jgi:hypothetical protein
MNRRPNPADLETRDARPAQRRTHDTEHDLLHYRRIASVPTTRNMGRRQLRDNTLGVVVLPVTERLADVGI